MLQLGFILLIVLLVAGAVAGSVTAAVISLTDPKDPSVLWGCVDGECVISPLGQWTDPADCSCGLCDGGACMATSGGGVYPSVSACVKDNGTWCSHPNLGWAFNAVAGNPQLCRQTITGGAGVVRRLADCKGWTCQGDPGPTSQCIPAPNNQGEFSTYAECFADDTRKCGWMYGCA